MLQNSKVVAPFLYFRVFLRIFQRFQNEKVSFVTPCRPLGRHKHFIEIFRDFCDFRGKNVFLQF